MPRSLLTIILWLTSLPIVAGMLPNRPVGTLDLARHSGQMRLARA